MRRWLPFALLAAVPVLLLARSFPAEGAGLYVRLAAALAVVLLPGALVAAALGRREEPPVSATVAWSLAAVAAGLGLAFQTAATIETAVVVLAVVGAAGVAGIAFRIRRHRPNDDAAARMRSLVTAIGVGLVGVGFGIALWQVAGHVGGDQLFHLARTRKLLELDALSLARVNEFANGDLHPGYAFPLWHGFLALIAWLAGVDPEQVVLHGPSVIAPLAVVVAYEAGAAVFRSAWLGAATAAAQVTLIALTPPHAGAYPTITGPGTAGRQLLVFAVVALFFAYVATPSWALLGATAAATGALAAVHVTYAVFLFVPLAGFVALRAAMEWREAPRALAALAAVGVPTAAVSLALLPLAERTASRTPAAEERKRALEHYASQLEVFSETSYRVAPEVLARTGAIAIAALVLVPVAALAARRRWGAFALGGSVAVLLLTLVPSLFTWLSDASSLSQSRRAAGFVPFAFVLVAGAAVLAGVLRYAVLPLALVAGWWLRDEYPGSFGTELGAGGGPEIVVWIALVGGLGALLFALVARPHGVDRLGWVPAAAVALFVLPSVVRGFEEWTPSPERKPSPLTRNVVTQLRERVPPGSVVFSDLETSYRVLAAAPVYAAAAPPAHVADTVRNRPYERRQDVLDFYRTGNLAIPRRYSARWLLVDRTKRRPRLELKPVYRDRRYALYKLPRAG